LAIGLFVSKIGFAGAAKVVCLQAKGTAVEAM